MDFNKALQHTLKFEGGYAHDPDDRGGETFRGISRRSWPDWPGWILIDRTKEAGLLGAKAIDSRFAADEKMKGLVADFYYRRFWRPVEGVNPPRLRAKLFDTAVNVGLVRAVKFLQGAINDFETSEPLTVDGVPGPKTRTALTMALTLAQAEGQLLMGFVRRQSDHYQALAKRPGQTKFLRGWLRRAEWLPPEEG